ncbi:tetratricopeptide repeat protein [Marinagarivorans algicola]|uniref:tetratricopeptide repeat protein n=1 Tax=Marinagarivorans algicola TaxID=1513270 RepID=UPI0012E2A8BD|nr:tetratricopeptide repeat protein [Marinagarivorans algicola]
MFVNQYMAFSKGLVGAGLLLALVCICVSGCAVSPKNDTEQMSEVVLDETTGEPILVLIPDPYLLSNTEVSADVSAKFQQGIALIEDQKWSQAQIHFEQLTQQVPTFSGPWVNLGLSLWRQDLYEPAEHAFEQAILKNDKNGDAYNLYAVMMREQGDFKKAEALYKQAIAVWPHNVISHRNLGVLYDMYMGRFDEAYYHFEQCAKIMATPDKKLRGWMVDIKRRQAKMAKKQKQSGATAPAESTEQGAANESSNAI